MSRQPRHYTDVLHQRAAPPSYAGKRIGIYAGTFDPVHAGHVGFALQAIKAGKLDEVVFMPERLPRQKPGVSHYGHRVAMLKRALKHYKHMAVLEVVDRHFTVKRTLTALARLFPEAELVMMVGSDVVSSMPHWPHADQLIGSTELLVGVRGEDAIIELSDRISQWQTAPRALTIVASAVPDVSSGKIRQALRENQHTKGLLASVHRYTRQEWLYVSLKTVTKSV